VLETDRLSLRPWRVSDAAFHRRLWLERDPRVPPHRRIDANGRPTVAELEDRIRALPEDAPLRLLVVELSATGEPIGYCGLIENAALPPDEPEIAYELLRGHWGAGYATEAASAVVELARASGYPRLWATVRAWNTSSLRVLAKLGFAETGRVEADPVHGDSLCMMRNL